MCFLLKIDLNSRRICVALPSKMIRSGRLKSGIVWTLVFKAKATKPTNFSRCTIGFLVKVGNVPLPIQRCGRRAQRFCGCFQTPPARTAAIFDFLSREPFTEGESTQADHVARRCQVRRFGVWLVTYWPEHLVKEIHILDIERLA
jgi:hypothetical protein